MSIPMENLAEYLSNIGALKGGELQCPEGAHVIYLTLLHTSTRSVGFCLYAQGISREMVGTLDGNNSDCYHAERASLRGDLLSWSAVQNYGGYDIESSDFTGEDLSVREEFVAPLSSVVSVKIVRGV